jgi:hypothetical protein
MAAGLALIMLLATQPAASPAAPDGGGAAARAPAAPALPGTAALPGALSAPIVMPIGNDSLSLFAVMLDNATLAESMAVYGDPADPLIPIGELGRLLELDIKVMPAEKRVTGRIGESGRALLIDLGSGAAMIGAREVTLAPRAAGMSPTDIFIAASQLQKLLPLKIEVDADNLLLTLTATEPLPIQSRRARQQRLYGLSEMPSVTEEAMKVASPYRWTGLPAFDFTVGAEGDSARGGLVNRYEARVAADLLKTSFSAYLASDDRGHPSSARIRFERRSADGDLFGPLHATYAAAGDVYTPTLSLGPRSFPGFGATFSTGQFQDTNIFQRISLRGELPIGYDVELYVNDVLRSGQNTAVQGRYEFNDVPLSRGVNIIRIVTYGPHGERAETTRVVNVGGGQLAPGRTVIDGGIVAQDRPLFQLPGGQALPTNLGRGDLRAVLGVTHGVSANLTVNAGGAAFSDSLGKQHVEFTAGARTSLLGLALQTDLAHDLEGGSAAALGAAGKLLGVNFIARHAEYRGGFYDETNSLYDLYRPLRRYSSLDVDFSSPLFSGLTLPLAGHIERGEFTDGGTSWIARGRSAVTLADTLFAVGLDYQTITLGTDGVPQGRTFSANVAASRSIDYKWQLRGALEYNIVPDAQVRSLSLTLDRLLGPVLSARVGLAKAFGYTRDLTTQLGLTARLPFGTASGFSEYSTDQKRWRVGIQLSFGLVFDPFARRYRLTGPGPANGGSAAMLAFLDRNADGRFNRGDEAVPGLVLQGGDRPVVTDAKGRAFVTGLGDTPMAMLHTDLSNIDLPFASSPPQNISLSPRAGNVAQILYPIVPTTEIAVRLHFRQKDGSSTGLAAVQLRLIPETGTATDAATEFDGTAVFEEVRPGKYRIAIDEEQADRLHMRLAEPIAIEIGPDGRPQTVARDIVFDRTNTQ